MNRVQFLRPLAIVLAGASAGAMFYVGLYQSRTIGRLWCPVNGAGCEAVADARFARPFGVPDGYIGAALYAIMLALLLVPGDIGAGTVLFALGVLAVGANAIGVYDMIRLGAFCTYCLLTSAASPLLLWALWRLR